MVVYNYSTAELIAGAKRAAKTNPIYESMQKAVVSALSGEESRAYRMTLHINAYFTASDRFIANPPDSDTVVEGHLYLAACNALGRFIERDAELTLDDERRWVMASYLSNFREAMENETRDNI